MPASQTRAKPGSTINYYQVLDVPYTATKTDIARAYRALIRHAHPDRFMDEASRLKAEERTKLLNAAYTVLTKPELRQEHDEVIRHHAVDDALFARYTGNTAPGTPGGLNGNGFQGSPYHQMQRVTKPPPSPEMVRAQRRAYRSASLHFIITVIIFVLAIGLGVIAVSAIMQGADIVFS